MGLATVLSADELFEGIRDAAQLGNCPGGHRDTLLVLALAIGIAYVVACTL